MTAAGSSNGLPQTCAIPGGTITVSPASATQASLARLTRDGGRDRALRHLGRPVGVGAGACYSSVASVAPHKSQCACAGRVVSRGCGGEPEVGACAPSTNPIHQRDTGGERGTYGQCAEHRSEPDGMLVVENRVNAVTDGPSPATGARCP